MAKAVQLALILTALLALGLAVFTNHAVVFNAAASRLLILYSAIACLVCLVGGGYMLTKTRVLIAFGVVFMIAAAIVLTDDAFILLGMKRFF